jgi:hypothetical protein
MTLENIKANLAAGRQVFWKQDNYQVIQDSIGQYLIKCTTNDNVIGLTWTDETTLNGDEEDFYL